MAKITVQEFVTYLSSIFGKTKFQQKFLLADNGGGALTDLTFNNLEIGKKYKVTMQGMIDGAGSTASGYIRAFHNSAQILEASVANSSIHGNSSSRLFVATATTLTFTYVSNSAGDIQGNGTDAETWAILEELPNHEVTTQWT